MIHKFPTIHKFGDEIKFSLSSTINEYSENKEYYACALVKKNGKTYINKSNYVLSGVFDSTKWTEISEDEINAFYLDTDYTKQPVNYDFCNFRFNPFLKLAIINMNIKFNSAVQTSFNSSNAYITFSKQYRGYGSWSGFSLDSSNNVMYSGNPICGQFGGSALNNITLWTNGTSELYGIYTNSSLVFLETEKKL